MTDKELLQAVIHDFNTFQNRLAGEKLWDIKMDIEKGTNTDGRYSRIRIHNYHHLMLKYELPNWKTSLLYKMAVRMMMNYAIANLYRDAKKRNEDHIAGMP